VGEFVGHEVGEDEVQIVVEKRASRGGAVVRFVMLEAVASDDVTQRI
jgi:hypothetical protein